MSVRAGLVLAATAVGVAASPIIAAPAKSLCFQINDAEGDATYLTAVPSPSLDILSADIATGPKNLVATLRLKSLKQEAHQVGGMSYWFKWTLNGAPQQLVHYVTSDGSHEAEYERATFDKITVTSVVDTAAATITWTVPRKSVLGLKPGASFADLKIQASQGNNYPIGMRGGSGVDDATATKAYKDGTKTCLKGT
jgi:hypothetical protein